MGQSPAWNNIPLYDTNGNLLVNGTIYVYNGGSWTVEAQDPVSVNAQGVATSFPLSANASYNLKLCDQYDNIISVLEGIVGITPPPSSPWTLEYTDTGTGNANGNGFQSIVSDDVGDLAYAYAGEFESVSSTNGGNTWTSNTSFPGNFMYSIFFNGTYFIAIDGNGTIYSTTDLNTWITIGTVSGAYQLYQDPANGTIYACPYDGSNPDVNLYRIAPNSNTLTQVITNAPGPNGATNFLTAGGITVGTYGNYPDYTIWKSTNEGITWQEAATTFSENIFEGLSYNNGLWGVNTVNINASGYPTEFWTSPDANTWTRQIQTLSGPPYQNEIVDFKNLFISFQGTNLATSPDGATWTLQTYGGTEIFGITVNVGGTRAYLYAQDGIWESTDGITWTATTVTNYTSDVECAGVTLAISSTYGSTPAFIYKRT